MTDQAEKHGPVAAMALLEPIPRRTTPPWLSFAARALRALFRCLRWTTR